ncbi:hypothetical protein NC651_015460 [Populus alba x Populus x berolinensis]|nr:hypothetical protein NC651_015460 [Populus alba x Populus x berolinensis]
MAVIGVLQMANLLTLSLATKPLVQGFKSQETNTCSGKIDMPTKVGLPGNSAGTVHRLLSILLLVMQRTKGNRFLSFSGNLKWRTLYSFTKPTSSLKEKETDEQQVLSLVQTPPKTSTLHYSVLWNPLSIILSVDGTR